MTRIEELSVAEWKMVFPDAVEDYAFFKTLDESDFKQFSFYYCLVYDDDIPVGATTFFLTDFNIDMAFKGPLRRITTTLRKFSPKLLSIKTLFCGVPMGQGRIGLKGDDEKIIGAICDSLEGLARRERASVLVFKDFNLSHAKTLEPFLIKRGFLRSQSLPSTIIKIEFDNFEGYLRTLSSSSREGFRRKFKKIEKNPPALLEVTNSLDDKTAQEAHGLYMQTALHSDIEFEVLPPDFFRNISKNMPEQTRFFLWRIEGKLVTFALCFVSGDYFVDYYLGFDYSVAHQYNLYLVRFRDMMNWCIANKMRVYEMGQSSYEIKRRLGFEFLPLFIYSKSCSKFIAPFFRFHHRFLMFESFDPVFKEMQKNPVIPA